MKKLAAGVLKFQQQEYPKRKELFDELAKGQAPRALFIACADSRVDPSLITQTEPGELFIVRNAGNIVPPHTNNTGATTASIEFAVGALNVRHVIVCGHSQCGAMKGAMAPDKLDSLPHVRQWLSYVRSAEQVVCEQHPDLDEGAHLDQLIRENVVQQLVHLRTHPYVAARIATGKLFLHGWVYDIEHGGVQAYNETTRTFGPVDEAYRDSIGELVGDKPES